MRARLLHIQEARESVGNTINFRSVQTLWFSISAVVERVCDTMILHHVTISSPSYLSFAELKCLDRLEIDSMTKIMRSLQYLTPPPPPTWQAKTPQFL